MGIPPEMLGRIFDVFTQGPRTADRAEFLGRNGTPANPASMRRVRLSGRVGAGLDPCTAMQIHIALEDGQDKDIVFILGAAHNEDQARQLAHR